MVDHPILRQTVLDAVGAPGTRRLAEFYRLLLGLRYRIGDEPPPSGEPDPQAGQWLALRDAAGLPVLAFQPVDALPPTSWPTNDHPQRLHLDLTVPTVADLAHQHDRALALGARLLLGRSDDPHEPLHVYADPPGSRSASSSPREGRTTVTDPLRGTPAGCRTGRGRRFAGTRGSRCPR